MCVCVCVRTCVCVCVRARVCVCVSKRYNTSYNFLHVCGSFLSFQPKRQQRFNQWFSKVHACMCIGASPEPTVLTIPLFLRPMQKFCHILKARHTHVIDTRHDISLFQNKNKHKQGEHNVVQGSLRYLSESSNACDRSWRNTRHYHQIRDLFIA